MYTAGTDKIIIWGVYGWQLLIAALIGLAVCLIIVFCIRGKYRMKFGNYKYKYKENSTLHLRHRRDIFVSQSVTQQRIQTNRRL